MSGLAKALQLVASEGPDAAGANSGGGIGDTAAPAVTQQRSMGLSSL